MRCFRSTGLPAAKLQACQVVRTSVLTPRLQNCKTALRCAAAKAELTSPPKEPGLYLLHWHNSSPQAVQAAQLGDEASAGGEMYVDKLRTELKMMEKVAKEAVWFSAVDADDGQHVLLVTDEKKLGSKYDLTLVEGDAYSLELPGKSVSIPLASILQQIAAKEIEDSDSSSSSSSDEDCDDVQALTAAEGAMGFVNALKETKEDEKKKGKKQKKEKLKLVQGTEDKEAALGRGMAAQQTMPQRLMDDEESSSSSSSSDEDE